MSQTLRTLLCGTALLSGLAAAAAEELPAMQDPVAVYARLAAAPVATRCAGPKTVTVPVALGEGAAEIRFDAAAGRLRILYRMSFNQLTEGWNWHPLAPAEGGDYYLYKYLPLGSTSEDRGGYRGEDKIGSPQDFRVQWRYDYFFAFDNPYDFYPRAADDDAGFSVDIALPAGDAARLARGDLGMALRGRLKPDCVSDSTTFWKATSAQPVDFTLKKRYLVGSLEEVWFYDVASGRVLGRISSAGKPAH